MDILTISHLSKTFGANHVICDLNISLPTRSIFGFIGQNGAGKTTTMKMILGLIKPDKGTILVNGSPVVFRKSQTNKHIGFLPDVPEFYSFLTPYEYLALCGEITGMSPSQTKEVSARLLTLCGLTDANRRIGSFSRGMKQRLGIAQALLNSPKLLICDEPTSALDPAGRKEVLDILHTVKKHTAVLFSTHILSDVERICDQIAFLHQGTIACSGTLEELRSIQRTKQGSQIELEFFHSEHANLFCSEYKKSRQIEDCRVLHTLSQEDSCINASSINTSSINALSIDASSINASSINASFINTINGILHWLSTNNIPIRWLEILEPSLEDLFLEVIGK